MFAALKNLGSEFAKDKENEAKTDLFTEGRRLLADVVGEAFASVFPAQWRELILGPSKSPAASPAAPAGSGADTGTDSGTANG